MLRKQPDKKRAQSLVALAKQEIDFTLSLPVTAQSATTIVRNIYEAFRMLGKALLVANGEREEQADHITSINVLLKLQVNTHRPLGVLTTLRTTRHNINYQGYVPNLKEVEDVIDIAKKLFFPVHKEVAWLVGK